MLEIIDSKSNLFKYYRTQNSITSNTHIPLLNNINDIPYGLVSTGETFYIYNLQDLSLQFMGPYFKKISNIIFDNVFVLVSEGNIISLITRGD
ncbi:MAG: hypothetical protein KC414_15205, partial [Romboutsia sp.]|nr:hypothetical protein [Romboutsia sp.]